MGVPSVATLAAAWGSSSSSTPTSSTTAATTAPGSSATGSAAGSLSAPANPPAITIGGANFSESTLVANIYGDALKKAGFKVTTTDLVDLNSQISTSQEAPASAAASSVASKSLG